MKTIHNAIAPMITPMFENGAVDYQSLSSLADHLIQRGISALYPCGTTGEVNNLTVEERKKIAETVIGAGNRRVPVFVQIGGETTDDSTNLAKHAVSAGADGIGILTPTYYRLDEDELFEYYCTIASNVPEDFPIYLYGIPGCAANELSLPLVKRIAEACPNVLGIKYSVGQILTLMDFMEVRDGDFQVLVAPAQMLLPALAAGVTGIVSGTCNVFVEEINEVMRLFNEGKIDACRKLQKNLAACSNYIAAKEVANCKALLKRKGIISSDAMRKPQRTLTDEERLQLFDFVDGNYSWYSYRK